MPTQSPTDRRYLSTHEWHRPDADGLVTIGISAFAVDELTDITYVDVARTTGAIAAGDVFGEVESVKATSDLYCGVAGEVVEVNQAVLDSPELINDDCYDAGWLIKVRPAGDAQQAVSALLDASAYDAQAGGH